MSDKTDPTESRVISEDRGAEMIIALQSMAGVVETKEEAILGWKRMSPSERAMTIKYYDIFFRKDNKDG